MVRSRFARPGLALLAVALLLAQAGPVASASGRLAALPSRCRPGAEIQRRNRLPASMALEAHRFGNRNEWSVWVIRKNGDGSLDGPNGERSGERRHTFRRSGAGRDASDRDSPIRLTGSQNRGPEC